MGFGAHLFNDWRFLDEKGQQPNPDFVLNFPQYQGTSILLTRESFDCDSSREHAPWMLIDYGFKVVIASSFADTFYDNNFSNQLLSMKLSDARVSELLVLVKTSPGTHFDINLEAQKVKAGEGACRFTIDAFRHYYMMNGPDSIGLTLQRGDAIASYEGRQPASMRWFVHRPALGRQEEKSQQIITAGVAINTNVRSHMMSTNRQSE